jgi:hypothetical protein
MSLQSNTKEVRPVMALTLRWTLACRERRQPSLLLAVGALSGLVIGAAVVVVFPDSYAHALDAAGAFKGEEIAGVAKFVATIQGSLVWLGGTAMGLVIAVVGIMFMAGHSRAHDVAIKTLVGLAILASISGIVA